MCQKCANSKLWCWKGENKPEKIMLYCFRCQLMSHAAEMYVSSKLRPTPFTV